VVLFVLNFPVFEQACANSFSTASWVAIYSANVRARARLSTARCFLASLVSLRCMRGMTAISATRLTSASNKKEIFVLRHDDLDLQNVLYDEEGNITAIVD
jgi:hypothetical protein